MMTKLHKKTCMNFVIILKHQIVIKFCFLINNIFIKKQNLEKIFLSKQRLFYKNITYRCKKKTIFLYFF